MRKKFGTINDEFLFGTPGRDLIAADSGNDVVRGGKCADIIGDYEQAVDGTITDDDRYYGGGGHDLILSYRGEDRLFGGRGDDLFVVQNPIGAKVFGGPGDDTLLVGYDWKVVEKTGDLTILSNGTGTIEARSVENIDVRGLVFNLLDYEYVF